MRVLTLCFALVSLFVIFLTTNATQDIRQRFEGLINKSVQVAWNQIDREAPGRPIEIMRDSSPQASKPITPGYVRVILSDKTGRVLYTPILQPN
ncbi:unnamed protein product [Rotaria magnacalcarata]|uniref:Uncharacterized protein n=1 Tax=Rotaria magnacalcarata TaxID=392030 RepID=A0A814QTR4_9BILA|nr:unnamed protein product [Rotaria magnacalcarata]CAF1595883.1 unnamed protein product [Rotaria magnacalcarata]CAF2126511.1 unnamed protein product [Rotaria magnacalcarata]CAF2229744.1 unnamed protein product [Rotaria magnacalcarata]CAF3796043.1 unnamed protein product [Rotaria magnacalcarata]